jgi:hypothetical protein
MEATSHRWRLTKHKLSEITLGHLRIRDAGLEAATVYDSKDVFHKMSLVTYSK